MNPNDSQEKTWHPCGLHSFNDPTFAQLSSEQKRQVLRQYPGWKFTRSNGSDGTMTKIRPKPSSIESFPATGLAHRSAALTRLSMSNKDLGSVTSNAIPTAFRTREKTSWATSIPTDARF